jgi:hypothetical protein
MFDWDFGLSSDPAYIVKKLDEAHGLTTSSQGQPMIDQIVLEIDGHFNP